MSKTTLGTVSDFSALFLAECKERELGPIFFIIAIGSNGGVQVQRVTTDPDWDTTPWTERSVDGVMVLPVMVAAINPETGRSVLARMDSEGVLRTLN